jgi:hypothetical protein
MFYLVEAHASMEPGNTIDAGEGRGPMFTQIVEQFHPEVFYGNPPRRWVFLFVNLETREQRMTNDNGTSFQLVSSGSLRPILAWRDVGVRDSRPR